MPIQVPELKQSMNIPQAAPSGQLPTDIPNGEKEIEKTTKAVVGAGVAFNDWQAKSELDAANSLADDKANQYEIAFKKGIYGDGVTPGIKFQAGDPTKLYADFDTNMKSKFDELVGDPEIPSSTSAVINKKLIDRANSLNYQRLTEYGYQQNKYDNDTADATVDLHKDRLSDATSFVKAGDPSTLAGIDSAVGDIRQTRLQQGVRTGSVIPDENGKTLMTGPDGQPMRVSVLPATDYQIRKDLSDGIYNAMDNLIKSGNVGAAQTMRDKYADYIEPAKKKSIADDFLKASVENKAYTIASTGGKNMDEQLKGVDDPALREKIKDKSMEIINDNQRRVEQMKDRSSKNNYNTLAMHVFQVQQKDGYAGVSDLESDPIFKNTIDRITDAKQREAIYAMVEQPKSTNIDTKSSIQTVMFGRDPKYPNGFRGMDPGEFNQMLVGAAKSDRDKYTAKFEQQNTQTGAQDNASYKMAGKSLEDQLQAIGYVTKDNYGHYSNDDQIKITKARDLLEDHLTSNGAPMTAKEINDYTKTLAGKVKAGTAFKDVAAPAPAPKFQGSINPPATPVVTDNGQPIKGKTRQEWNREFMRVNKRTTAPGQAGVIELNKFIDQQP